MAASLQSARSGLWRAQAAPFRQQRPRPQRLRLRLRSTTNGNGGDDGAGGDGAMSFDDDASSGLGRLRYNKWEERPPELQDLSITDDGFLIDGKTGKVINEFGATRFDVAVRALRGELDPAPWVENTERNPEPVLASKLINFPTPWIFQVVGRVSAESPKQAFVDDMLASIRATTQGEVSDVSVTERLGGKYVSLSATVTVRAPEIIQATYDAIGRDPRVKMKF